MKNMNVYYKDINLTVISNQIIEWNPVQSNQIGIDNTHGHDWAIDEVCPDTRRNFITGAAQGSGMHYNNTLK